MKRFLLAGLLLSLTACSFSSFGRITESVSEFDGASVMAMHRAKLLAPNGSDVVAYLSLSKRSTMPADVLVLIVSLCGPATISDPDSLRFDMDGEVQSFTSMDTAGELQEPRAHCDMVSKRYWVTQSLLKKLLDAKKVTVHIESEPASREGLFSQDGRRSARPAFREFYQRAFAPKE